MNFKGLFSLLNPPLAYSKSIIYSFNEGEESIHKEYTYANGKVQKIVDHINFIVSEYDHLNDEDFVVHFYRFEETPVDKIIDSIKEISEPGGKQTKEMLYDVIDGEKSKVYSGELKYDGDYLIEENYFYPDQRYTIKYDWNKNNSICNITHVGETQKLKYTFNKNGQLIESLNFQYEGTVKKTDYEYKDGKLFKLTDFPHLDYKNKLIGNGIKITGKAQFMNETEHYYFGNGLLEKEVTKDYDTKEVLKTVYYKYE